MTISKIGDIFADRIPSEIDLDLFNQAYNVCVGKHSKAWDFKILYKFFLEEVGIEIRRDGRYVYPYRVANAEQTLMFKLSL